MSILKRAHTCPEGAGEEVETELADTDKYAGVSV